MMEVHSVYKRNECHRLCHSRYCSVLILSSIIFILFMLCSNTRAETIYAVSSQGIVDVRDTDKIPKYIEDEPDELYETNGVLFQIWYEDDPGIGFNSGTERKARLREALTYVSSVLNEIGTIDVLIKASQFDGEGFLAQSGTWFSNSPRWQNGSAFERLRSKSDFKRFSGVEEFYILVDWGHPWNSKATIPKSYEYDLLSVLIHEITHGFGYMSLSDSDGSSKISKLDNVYSRLDDMLVTGTGFETDLFAMSGGMPAFMGTLSALIGAENGIFFSGENAIEEFGSAPPIYSPNPFKFGSSLAHWVSDNEITGDAVMQPIIYKGDVRREYASFEISALVDIGWTKAFESGVLPDHVFETSGEIIASDYLVEEGMEFNFIAPSGSNSPYQWYRDKVAIDGETSRVLEFEYIEVDDSGIYNVTYRRDDEKEIVVSLSYNLNVEEPGSLPAYNSSSLVIAITLIAGVSIIILHLKKWLIVNTSGFNRQNKL